MKKRIWTKIPKNGHCDEGRAAGGGMQGRESPVKVSKYFVVVETLVPKFYEGYLS